MALGVTAAPELAELLEMPYGRLRELVERFDLREWAAKHVRLPKGDRLDFGTHPFQRDLYADLSPEVAAIKGAQLGFSTWTIAKAMWVAIELSRNVIYSFPTRDDVSRFSAARINPIIRNSRYLSDRILDIDSVYVKQFSTHGAQARSGLEAQAVQAEARGDAAKVERARTQLAIGTIYFQGTGVGHRTLTGKAEREAMAVDSDFNVHDELDRSDPRTHEQYRERLAHSDMRWQHDLSTPSIPGRAIHKRWLLSDQHVWLVRCPQCAHEFELRFPGQPVEQGDEAYANVEPEPDRWRPGDPAHFVCHKCGKVLRDDVRLAARWVARRPGQRVRGYRLSQMSYVGVSAADLLLKWGQTVWKGDFWNLVMAMPYAERSENLARDLVLLATQPPLGGNALSPQHDGSLTTMGVDVGKYLHVVVRRPHPSLPGRWQTVWLEETTDWSRLDALMWQFNVLTCVIDAAPEERMAKAFADRHKGRVFRCYYGEAKKGVPIAFDPPQGKSEGTYVVRADRTVALDMDRDRFMAGQVGMPAYSEVVETFMRHCEVSFRQPVYQQVEGSDVRVVQKYEWVETGADHFRHASTYELLATLRFDPLLVTGPDTTTRLLGARSREAG